MPGNATEDRFIEISGSNDVCWILTSSFLIFTMQSGYALLESGIVSRKNEVNILLKNAVNIIGGAIGFWAFGYALSFGTPSNSIIGYGDFILNPDHTSMGQKYTQFIFQLAYSTTSTAIIAGSMSERCKFISWCIFSLVSTIIYCLPARWMLSKGGWLLQLGGVDIGGSGTVHLVGGCSGLVAAILLGPRIGRFDSGIGQLPMGNPTNALMGMFMLWWGWLGFSAGSTFGITGHKWKYSSRAAVTTIMASMGGGSVGMILSWIHRPGIQDIQTMLDSILASLVAISGGAPIFRPVFSLIIGGTAAILVVVITPLIKWCRIDDPTNSFAVHGIAGAWGMIAIGLFAEKDQLLDYTSGFGGLILDEDVHLMTSQLLSIAALTVWSLIATLVILLMIKTAFGLRMTTQEEILGPDFVDHGLVHDGNADLLKKLAMKLNLGSIDAVDLNLN